MFEYVYPQPQPENVHEVYAVAQFGKVGDQTGRIRAVYAGEHQESPHGKHYTVDGAEGPTYFYDGGCEYLSGDSLYIERVDGQYGPRYHESGPDSQSFVAVPGKVYPDVVCQHQISQVTGEVPQHMVFIPETLSPEFPEPPVQVGHTGREEEQGDEESLLFGRCLVEPGGYDGHEKVEADQRINQKCPANVGKFNSIRDRSFNDVAPSICPHSIGKVLYRTMKIKNGGRMRVNRCR